MSHDDNRPAKRGKTIYSFFKKSSNDPHSSGLRLAVANGFTKILIEMDSHIAVNLFQQRDSLCFHLLTALLSNCGKMLRHFESWNIQHIFREKNGLVDYLAKWSHNLDLDIQFFVSAPIWASSALANDLLGVTWAV
ncbi:unnamed protein product [Prunus armeniaca]